MLKQTEYSVLEILLRYEYEIFIIMSERRCGHVRVRARTCLLVSEKVLTCKVVWVTCVCMCVDFFIMDKGGVFRETVSFSAPFLV